MAEGLPDDGKVVTCEIDARHRDFAQRYFDRSPHGKKIEIRLGPALDTLKNLAGPFDFTFIDADKENYPGYFSRALELTRPGGLILLDNMLREGRVLNPQDPGTKAIDLVNKAIAADPGLENVLLTVRDGVQLVRKRA
jgi:caffeoyl-CoA O-methyltransferase